MLLQPKPDFSASSKKKSLNTLLWVIFTGYLLTISNAAFAQLDAGALQQNLEKQLPTPSPLALPTPSEPIQFEPKAHKESNVQFVVKAFQLEGINLLPEATAQETLRPWVGKSVSFDDLQKACSALIELYKKNGYTVQATLPAQKISGGVVKILVTEAKLSEVIVENPHGKSRFSNERAAEYITNANKLGDPLNLDDIERALIILNETPGVQVSSELEPGKNDGDTALRMQLTQPPLVQGRAEINNYGSRTTGANQGVIAINVNNPSGIGDQATVNGIASEGTGYVQGSYSLPVGTDGLRVGASGTYLNYKNVSNYATNGGYGDAWTAGINAAYPLVRKQTTNVNTILGYDIKSYMNKNLATNDVMSSYNIKNLTLGISGNHIDNLGHGGLSVGAANIVFGYLDILGTSPAGYGQFTPPSFTKFTFLGNRTQQLTEDGATSLYIAASGQFASTNLNSAEQFYLGGPAGVRAYPVAQGAGSQGGLGTLEIRQQLPERFLLSVFYDVGVVQQYKFPYLNWQGLTNANNTYSLMGAGLGLKWDYQGWNLGAMVAWAIGKNPLYSQTGSPVNTDGTASQPTGWFTASYSLQ